MVDVVADMGYEIGSKYIATDTVSCLLHVTGIVSFY